MSIEDAQERGKRQREKHENFACGPAVLVALVFGSSLLVGLAAVVVRMVA